MWELISLQRGLRLFYEELFIQRGFAVKYQNFKHPTYTVRRNFSPGVYLLNVLMNLGWESTTNLKNKDCSKSIGLRR